MPKAAGKIAAAVITAEDGRFMREALRLAKKGAGTASPNPAVGAVVVKNGRVIAKGWHKKAGLPHAEAVALSGKGLNARGATLYVTLEPCCHFGKTPPCTGAIIRAGIKRVVAGTRDPNPLVAGKGIKALKAAGIKTVTGVLEKECRSLNLAFNKFITSKIPYVTLKLAATLDGRIAASSGESRWITGAPARRYVHKIRAAADAVITGSSTVVKDDPELTVRHAAGVNPTRVVLDSAFKTPLNAKAFKRYPADRDARPPVVFTTARAPIKKVEKARVLGINVITVRAAGGKVDLKSVLKSLGKMGITSVLVEGGGTLAASFLKNKLVDRLLWFIAPKVIGADGVPAIGPLGIKKLGAAIELKDVKMRRLGTDMIVECGF